MKKLFIALVLIGSFANAEARDPAQVREFRRTHACPSTHKFVGACGTHVVDHIVPLCAGGKDLPSNMVWQEKNESYQKDIDERKLCSWVAKARLKKMKLGE